MSDKQSFSTNKQLTLEFFEQGNEKVPEVMGVPTRLANRLAAELSAALGERITNHNFNEGLYMQCKSETEVLRKFITVHNMQDEYGLNLETANGIFMLGYAFVEAIEHTHKVLAELSDRHGIKIDSIDKVKKLKKMLDEMLDD